MSNVRILEREQLIEAVTRLRSGGSTIVLANGCFDLFHVGHVRYLEGAKALGDVLVVAVNSDEQARRLKGDDRPVFPEAERAEIVASLRCVDIVTIFEEPNVEDLVGAIRPDVHAKGTDYTTDNVPEREVVIECGGRVAIVGDPKEHSTTSIFERMRNS